MLQKDTIVPSLDFSVSNAAEVPGRTLGRMPGFAGFLFGLLGREAASGFRMTLLYT